MRRKRRRSSRRRRRRRRRRSGRKRRRRLAKVLARVGRRMRRKGTGVDGPHCSKVW